MSHRIITHIGCLLMACGVTSAEPWRGFALWNPKESTTTNILGVIYQGGNLEAAQEIQIATGAVDRSSPQTLLRALFRALNQQDATLFNQLYLSGEQIPELGYVPDAHNKVLQMSLRRVLQYGDCSILLLDITVPALSYPFLYCVREKDGQFFATDSLKTDPAYRFLNSFYAFAPVAGMPMEQEFTKVTWSAPGFLYLTNFPVGENAQRNPLVFRFQGRDHGTNTVLGNWPAPDQQNLNSPTGALRAAFGALKTGDVNGYAALLHPLEKTNRLQYGWENGSKGRIWDEWMREKFPEAARRPIPASIRLKREIRYGNSAILVFEDAAGQLGVDWMGFRKQDALWFISDELNGSSSLVLDYLGLAANLNTKAFPSFTGKR